MKPIFTEQSEPVVVFVKWFDDEDYKTRTNQIKVGALTTAHYDTDLRVLVIDQSLDLGVSDWLKPLLAWELPPRRTLETHATEAQAVRRAVVLADDYADRMSKTVFDDERTDDEVQRAFLGE